MHTCIHVRICKHAHLHVYIHIHTDANDEDKKNSSVSHEVNVESDNIDISMTTNPSYGHLEMRSEHPKPLYGNL